MAGPRRRPLVVGAGVAVLLLVLNAAFGFVTVEFVGPRDKRGRVSPVHAAEPQPTAAGAGEGPEGEAPTDVKGLPVERVQPDAHVRGCGWNKLRVQDLPGIPASKAPVQFYDLYKLDQRQAIVDVGANDGAGLREALENGHTVFAFEPVRSCCQLLSTRFKRNPRFHLTCAVASNASGTLTLHESLAAGSASSTLSQGVVQGLRLATRATAVPSVTVDSILATHSPPLPILVFKSDTQGHELHVLRGSVQALRQRGVSYFYVEFDPFLLAQSGTDAAELLRWFHEHGYGCRYARQRKCKAYDGGALRRKCWTDLLCAPADRFAGSPTRCLPYTPTDFLGDTAGLTPWPF